MKKEDLNEMLLCFEEELKSIRLKDCLSIKEKIDRLHTEAKMMLAEKLFIYED